MPNASETSSFVSFKGGLTVPTEPLRLALDLEARGLRLRLDGDVLVVGPKHLLRDDDRAAIRMWSTDLKAVVGYAWAVGGQ
jgi:hypothetical protein